MLPPTSAAVDALGRTIESVERTNSDDFVTRMTYDIRGNVLTVEDPKQRTAARQVYDLANRKLRNESNDAGTSTAVFDAAGLPIEARDQRGALTLTAADEMLRSTHQWGRDSSTESVRLVGRTIFGYEMTGDPKATNHLGKPYRHYDEAGLVTVVAYDFKGNVLEKTRETVDPQKVIDAVDAASSANGYVVDTFRVDWSGTLSARKADLIDGSDYRTAYKSKTIFDGLDRPVEVTLPADQEDANAGYGKTITPRFNRAGALQSVAMSGADTPSVDYIAYNAKGQRILAALGNGVMTRYAYDENVFRLKRMRSEKYDPTSTPETGYTLPTDQSGKKYQDIVYAYDAVGNILTTDEHVTAVGIAGADTMLRTFTYDALYRLLSATGRESDILKTDPWQDQLAVKSQAGYDDTPQNTRWYKEIYTYDGVGGLTHLTHTYGSPSSQWVRDYTTETGSNRMTALDVGSNSYAYTYDASGNLIQENTERHFEWDFAGRMRAFRNQVAGSQATVFAHYTYDSGGQRVQKVVSKSGANPVHTVYIDGLFEHHVELASDGSTAAENNVLHVMDDTKRVATKRLGSELDGSNPPAVQYHLGDHLQSSAVVVDDTGAFYNREEYRPYGESSFGSFAKKRYRFTGKERDEESSLYYHGARYYAPWTARWTAPDPMGMVDGPNLYQYVSGNPARLVDPTGTRGHDEAAPDTLDILGAGAAAAVKGARSEVKAVVQGVRDKLSDSPPVTLAPLQDANAQEIVIVGSNIPSADSDPGKRLGKRSDPALIFANAASHLRKPNGKTRFLVERRGYIEAAKNRHKPRDFYIKRVEKLLGTKNITWIYAKSGIESAINEHTSQENPIGRLTIFSHGFPSHMSLRGKTRMKLTAKDFGFLKGKFAPTGSIVSHACNTGAQFAWAPYLDTPLAAQIAHAVGVPVSAWTGRTSYGHRNKNGEITKIYPSVVSRTDIFRESLESLGYGVGTQFQTWLPQ